jgi:DNA processing protein
MALQHWVRLALTDGLGPITIKRLTELAGSAQEACELGEMRLRQVEGIGLARSQAIARALRESADRAVAELERCEQLGVRVIALDDPAYPPVLKTIHDPPPVLYMRGSLEDRDLNAIAIVGSRRCTHYGREQAGRFGALLAEAGFTVVSGGARGVDSAAHRGAMEHPHGRTIAVLGCGIDVTYPQENEPLFAQISSRGALLSEFPLGTPPLADNFPRRNRVVSGLSRGVIVIEGDLRSGAMITARLAGEEQGRVVFALPGRVDHPMSSGPHRLIRDGAVLVDGLQDIIEGLGPLPHEVSQPTLFGPPPEDQGPAKAAVPVPLTARQQTIVAALDEEPLAVDQIIQRSGLEAPVVLQELTWLSLKGLVRRVDGQTFARAHRRADH